MLTRRENLLRVLRGQKPAWTPCSINLWQWYTHHKKFGTLPTELAGSSDQVDAMRRLGCDIFTRNAGGGLGLRREGVEVLKTEEAGSQGPRHIMQIRTPHGELRGIVEDQTALTTSYAVEDLVKDWSRDGKAYLWMLQRESYAWDEQAYAQLDQRIGDDGIILTAIAHTPLKKLHIDFGLDYSSLFMIEEPDAAKECCDLYWSRLWPSIERVARQPSVHAAIFMDNFDTPFYSPALCELYWTPYVRQAAELLAAHGKPLFVHACGKLKISVPTFRDARVRGLEGMAHPPLGDFTPTDAKRMPDYFIYNGGFTAQEQVIKSDDQVRSFYRDFFRELGDFPRFIFGAACQTAINTPWERIKLAVQLCRQYGGNQQESR
jgi:hypothetical protein